MMWLVVAVPAAVSLLAVPYCALTRPRRWGKIEPVASLPLPTPVPRLSDVHPRGVNPPVAPGATS